MLRKHTVVFTFINMCQPNWLILPTCLLSPRAYAQLIFSCIHMSLLVVQQLPVTLPQLISFKGRSRNMNLLELIGTHYWEFGILLLDDTVGEATKTIIERHHHDPTKINLEIFQKWILCRGKMPVEWSTLIDVLNSIGLVDLASEMEQTLSAQ